MSGINFDQMKKYTYTLVMILLWSATSVAQIKIGNHTFKDGSSYTGELKGRKPHGKGKTVFKSGYVYVGQYVKV